MKISQIKHQNFSDFFVGMETKTPTINGDFRPYINFDNAASTPPLKVVKKAVNDFLVYYSSVHRGTGFKSQLSTHIYEQARQIVTEFAGANPTTHTCIFGKNTTEAINKLAHRFPFTSKRNMVLTTAMEHHSNDLPWRKISQVIHVKLTPDGRLDEVDFDSKLADYRDQIALVAISGASNVTGYLNPIHRLAEKTHAIGAQIAVDCAQLAPHRKIEMLPLDNPGHLDYITISAHKMYAPFGTGALIGRRDTFERGDPDTVGGGTVEIVTLNDVVWGAPPDRDEAGSPNIVGAVALAAAICQLSKIGMEIIAQHESDLTEYALKEFDKIPTIKIYGDPNSKSTNNRLGVIPFNLNGLSHFKVAAILGHEYGIGVRNGCFCAHPYILHLLGLSTSQAEIVRENILNGDKSEMPGLIRISFGLYNTFEEVKVLTEAVKSISQGNYQGNYTQDPSTGEFHPQGWKPNFDPYFSFMCT